MKKMSSDEINTNIFIKDGTSLRFYLPPGNEKQYLAPLVKKAGGLLSSKLTDRSIKLSADGVNVRSEERINYFRSVYITDCLKAGHLLPLSDYALNSRASARVMVEMRANSKQGRRRYRPFEDNKIIEYIKKHGSGCELAGNKIWKEMEQEKVTLHSWSSMRDRFLKILEPQMAEAGNTKKQQNNDNDKQDNECEADIDTDNSEEFVTHKKASSTERHREASSVCLPRDQIGEPPGECLPGNHTLDLLSGDDIISEPSDQDAFDKELLEIATRGYDIAMNNLSTTSADSSAIRVTKSIRRRGGQRHSLARFVMESQENQSDADNKHVDDGDVINEGHCSETNEDVTASDPPSTRRAHQTHLGNKAHPGHHKRLAPQQTDTDAAHVADCQRVTEALHNVLYEPGNSLSVVQKVQRILDWLDLEHEEYLDALWRFGGDMTHAVQWILCGRTEQGLEGWTPEDDQILLEGSQDHMLRRLDEKYGQENVTKRSEFLIQNIDIT